MKFRLSAVLALCSCPWFAAAQVADADAALAAVPILELPAIDIDKALGEDLAKAKLAPGPVRYALGHAVDDVVAGGEKSRGGRWETLADGRLRWQLEIHAPDAVSIDLGFKPFRLPAGAEMVVVDVHSGDKAGPFTDADNPRGGEFWTPIQRTDRVRIELTLPADKREFLKLQLDTVHHGYKDLVAAVRQKSGSCNVDVVCPAGDAWRDEIRAVAVVAHNDSATREGNSCSGTFVRSTAPMAGPLFLSANHCEIVGSSARVYFNFQNSTCRTPGSAASGANGDGPLNVSLFGATMLAQTDPSGGVVSSDFAIMRFNNPAPAAANLFLSGWDRRDLAPDSATGIHHPQGDEKRISFENDPLSIAGYGADPGNGNTHLRIADWDVGTTERGSSGSGLWNDDGRLVGVLSGGEAACGNDAPDWYGRIAHGWEGLGTPDRRLRDWLDNGNTNAKTLDGTNACTLNASIESTAFTSNPAAGASVVYTAAATGATGTVTYSWDVDGDGSIDRTGTQPSITVTYPRAGSYQVVVDATDANRCGGIASRAVDVVGASIAATGGAAQQVCGDNDSAIEPGERWRVPVTLRNGGAGALPAGGRALFAAGTSSASFPLGPNGFGYVGTTSAAGGCGYSFIDIASGATSVPALVTDDDDDGRAVNPIALGGTGFELYGQRYTTAVMSTNGFISFSAAETGVEYANTCTGELGEGGAGPQLRVHHDDLVVAAQAGSGLRYRYFDVCPRAAESDSAPQGCHVFQWSHMQRYAQSGAVGDFEFQAIAYERSGQITYQYRDAAPDAGAGATIGVTSATGTDPLNAACNVANAAPAQSAICLFEPSALPGGDAGLRVETPAVSVPAIAAGGQTVVDVPIAIASSAQCGAALALDYIATAAPGISSFADSTVLQAVIGDGTACQTSTACPAQVPAIASRQGLYSNPQRGGNGLANFVYGSLYGGAWYTALEDRTPTWYILSGEYSDNLGTMPITRVRNTAAPGSVATVSDLVGRAWVATIDADHLMYAWSLDGQSSGAELMQSQGLPFTTPNHTQTWYSTAQSGWGLAIESLQTGPTSVLDFIGAYIYDAGGTARWLTGSSTNITGGPVDLTAYRVHCPGCPWFADWASTGQPAGSLNRTYTDATHGTLSTAITLPAPLSGTWNRSNLPITTIGTPVPAKSDAE
jgi:lysyl endopeptidase